MSSTVPPVALLTELSPLPKCCCDMGPLGTLVLTATDAAMRPDVQGLALLMRRDEEWTEVPIFMDGDSLLLPESVKRLVRNADLSKRLQEAAGARSSAATPPSLAVFVASCQQVFEELAAAIVTPALAKRTVSTSTTTTSLASVEELFLQLQAADRRYGSDVIWAVDDDLAHCSLQYVDKAGRQHVLQMDTSGIPRNPPVCTVQLPRAWKPPWPATPTVPSSSNKKRRRENPNDDDDCGLVLLYCDFCGHVDRYQDFWNQLDDFDEHTIVLEPSGVPSRAMCHRRIALTESTSVMITLNPLEPRAIPDKIRWMGNNTSLYRQRYQDYISNDADGESWSKDLSVRENLERCLGIDLPRPAAPKPEATEEVDCSICYTHELPIEDEGNIELPATICDTCGRQYHDSCLREWLQSLPSSRVSFDRILGSCPYCKEYISATLHS